MQGIKYKSAEHKSAERKSAVLTDDVASVEQALVEYLHRQDPRAWTHELLLRPSQTEWTTPT